MRKIRITALKITALIALTGFGLMPAQANEKFRADYSISAIGIPVGKSRFQTNVGEDGSYSVEGTLRSSGVARLFASINGSLIAKGAKSNNTVSSRQFSARYTEGKKAKSTNFAISDGTITGAKNTPERKRPKKWVPLKQSDLAGALDPIAAIMVPAASAREVCGRTLKAFDGLMRMDVRLSYLRTVPFSTRGFKGNVVTCRGKFVPISGYDSNKKDINWMRDNGVIDVAFAPVGTTGYFAPVNAQIKTRLVNLRIRATRFEQLTD